MHFSYGIDHSYKARVKCKIGYDGGLITSHEKWQKFQCYAENFVLLVVQGFYRLVLHALLHLRLRNRYRSTMKILIMCPATIRSENISEQAQGDLLQTQSQDDEQAPGNPLPPELP